MAVANAVEGWTTEIAGGVEAAWTARELLTHRLGNSTGDDTMHDLHLLTTELVTNAVLHAGAGEADKIELRVATEPDRVLVSVTDSGGDETPEVQGPDPVVRPGGASSWPDT